MIVIGVLTAIRRKQAARENEEFQQYLFPKRKPATEADMHWSEITHGVLGIAIAVFAAVMLVNSLAGQPLH